MTLPRSMDDFGPEDMAIPELKLIQNVGGDWAKTLGAQPGDFFLSLSDEVIKGEVGIDITIVDVKKVRTFWGRTEIEDAPPECTSEDLTYGSDGTECASCPNRSDTPWLLDTMERRAKCTIDYNIICINNGSALMLRAGGISSTPVKELISQLRLNKQLKGEYHRAIIHVSSAKKKTAAGEAFALHFCISGLVQDPQAESLLAQSSQILGLPMVPALETSPKAAQLEAPPAPALEKVPVPEEKSEKKIDMDF